MRRFLEFCVGAWVLPGGMESVAAIALGAAFLVLGKALLGDLVRGPRWLSVGFLATLAGALSAAYVAFYLGDGPRIIDATSYFLEAKMFSQGHVTLPLGTPSASVLGRFMVRTVTADGARWGVIFPPGYPALLAMALWANCPMMLGPLLAVALVVCTYALAQRLTGRHEIAILAALFSTLSAALRYHTADTMSHGLCALLLTLMLLCVLTGGKEHAAPSSLRFALGGLCMGWLAACRPLSFAATFVLLLLGRRVSFRQSMTIGAGALVPMVLALCEQRAVTGHWLTSSQSLYYAMSDGPPGCFHYGFGSSIGCQYEHGDYVQARLTQGHGAVSALLIAGMRLRLHVLDIANFEPLGILAVVAPWLCASVRPLRWALPAFMLAYAPFYFDGSYPGAGARMYADILPLQHIILAAGLVAATRYAARRWPTRVDGPRLQGFGVALSCLGFATHAVSSHRALASRDGGRPYFERAPLERVTTQAGLLWVDSDHGFNLAFDPNADDAQHEWVVRRPAGDDRDRLVWEGLGRPPAFSYFFDGNGVYAPALVPWAPSTSPPPYRFEAEVAWPPLTQHNGWFQPSYASATCAWGGKVLDVHVQPGESFEGQILVPVPWSGFWSVEPHIVTRGRAVARVSVEQGEHATSLASWMVVGAQGPFRCQTLEAHLVHLLAGEARVRIQLEGEAAHLRAQPAPEEGGTGSNGIMREPLFALDAFALAPVTPEKH